MEKALFRRVSVLAGGFGLDGALAALGAGDLADVLDLVTSLEAVGLSSFAKRLEEWGAVQAIERLNLDGLLALWHPPIAN